jgi:non-specific serine/threonine protein kinase/serine/threonine-protein kinase
MDTKQVIARFEAERQAVAMMDHPSIAKVFDAGTTDRGRPYFVMEHVPGLPVTAYCDKERLDLEQRLHLFLQACDAIQHAHQKGIIHRDIKPSNILVEHVGDQHVPKVIDFGIAKAMGFQLTERTLFTERGQLIGTPEYMSPEQAEGSELGVDTRTDIYSLGVVLYELLAGVLPFDPQAFRDKGFSEIQHVIRDVEPPKPSTRLSALNGGTRADPESTAALVARDRRTDPRTLRRRLTGDLDWVVMKALEKDRSRRYATASELATDLRRHLEHVPVAAGPPSATYRIRKYVRRHRLGVAAASIVVVGLLAAVALSMGFALSEARQRRAAHTEREIAQAVNEFLNRDLLAAIAPSIEKGRGKDVLMRDVVDRAADRIEEASGSGGRFENNPLVEASIRQTLGSTYNRLGEYASAEPHLTRALVLRTRALGKENSRTLSTMRSLAWLYQEQARYDEAEPLALESFELRQRVLGEEHPDTLDSMALLGFLYTLQGKYDKATPILVRALEYQQRILGEEHLDTLETMNSLGVTYNKQARYDAAEPLYVKTLEIRKRLLGVENPATLDTMNNLAVLYRVQERFGEAEPLYLETVEIRKRLLGEEHPDTLGTINSLAHLYLYQQRYDEAEPLFVEVIELQTRVLTEDHPRTAGSITNLAILYAVQGRFDDAEPKFLKAFEIRKRVMGENHPQTVLSMNNVGNNYLDLGRYEEAAAILEDAVAVAPRAWPDGHWFIGVIEGNYGKTLTKLSRYEDAEAQLLQAHARTSEGLGPQHSRTLSQAESLVHLYDAWGKPDKADEYRQLLPEAQEAVASD